MNMKFNPLTYDFELVDHTPIVTSGNANVDCKLDTITLIDMNSSVSITLETVPFDGCYHDIGIILNTGEETYPVSFPENVIWYKDLVIEPNHRYFINIFRGDAIWISFPIEK